MKRYLMLGLAAILTSCDSNELIKTLDKCSIPYTLDGTNDYWQTVNETKKRGTGDCEDMAFYLNDELSKKGYNSRVVIGVVNPQAKILHAWVELQYKGRQYVMDPTGNLMFEKRAIFHYIEFPKFIFRDKIKDWEKRNEW